MKVNVDAIENNKHQQRKRRQQQQQQQQLTAEILLNIAQTFFPMNLIRKHDAENTTILLYQYRVLASPNVVRSVIVSIHEK